MGLLDSIKKHVPGTEEYGDRKDVEQQKREIKADVKEATTSMKIRGRKDISDERKNVLLEKVEYEAEREKLSPAKRVFTSTPVKWLDKGARAVSKVAKNVGTKSIKEIKQARPWDVQGRPREEPTSKPSSYRMPGRPKSPRHSESLGGFKSPTYHKGEMYMPSARSFDTGLGMGTSRSKKKKKTGVPRALDMNFDWEI